MNIFNKIKLFFKRWHNKFFATLFISLALIFFLGNYVYDEFLFDWTYFVSYPTDLLNFFLYLIVYFVILYGNIKNNNIAYTGILLFVCMLVIDCAMNLIDILSNPISLSGETLTLVFYFLGLGIQIAEVVIGILYYRSIQKYSIHALDNFKKLRIYGIIFACLLFVQLAPVIALAILAGKGGFYLLIAFSLSLSELFASISCVWTVERLERK